MAKPRGCLPAGEYVRKASKYSPHTLAYSHALALDLATSQHLQATRSSSINRQVLSSLVISFCPPSRPNTWSRNASESRARMAITLAGVLGRALASHRLARTVGVGIPTCTVRYSSLSEALQYLQVRVPGKIVANSENVRNSSGCTTWYSYSLTARRPPPSRS